MTSDRPSTLVGIAATRGRESGFSSSAWTRFGRSSDAQIYEEIAGAATKQFGCDYSERRICDENSLAVDFYFPEEETIVEIALGLPNSATEYEKDVIKAIMAQETGQPVRKLIFISRAGGEKNLSLERIFKSI